MGTCKSVCMDRMYTKNMETMHNDDDEGETHQNLTAPIGIYNIT